MPVQYYGPRGYILMSGHPEALDRGIPIAAPTELSIEAPHEKLFIRTHQTIEIWVQQMLDEVDFGRAVLSRERVAENEISAVTHHMARVTSVLRLLTAHMDVLETLASTDFFDFRQNLFGAAGFDSFRFREFEWALGLMDRGLTDYLTARCEHFVGAEESAEVGRRYQGFWADRTDRVTDASTEELRRRRAELEQRRSLRALMFDWLARTPYPDPAGGRPDPRHRRAFIDRFTANFAAAYARDIEQARAADPAGPGAGHSAHSTGDIDAAIRRLHWFVDAPERCALLFILQFAHEPLLSWPAELLEGVLELDQGVVTWRNRHIEMVAHVLGGGRLSTGGQKGSGLGYLRKTMLLRALPEASDARSFLMGHREARGMYPEVAWRGYRLAFE
jgi:tryptophan 2,3-dioxygenase